MKIGFLCERMLLGFGVDLVVHNKAEVLGQLGHEVTVYTLRTDETFNNKHYKIVKLNSGLHLNPIKTELGVVKNTARFLNNQDVEIWISETYPFHILTWFLKKPVFIIEYGTSSSEGMPPKQKISFFYQKYLDRLLFFPLARRIITISKYLKDTQVPIYLRSKTVHQHLGVDHYINDFKKRKGNSSALRKKLGIKEKDFVLLYVGRLRHKAQPYKGVVDLIEIFHRVRESNPEIKMIMAGYGDNEDKEQLEKEGIIALPCVPKEELEELYNLSHLYVSATKWEGFNLPMFEAQTFGKIPILYDIGPHSELMVNGDHAFLVKSQDEFVEKILLLSKDSKLREKMEKSALEHAAKFTWRANVEKFEALLREEINENPYQKDWVDVITLNYNGKKITEDLFNSLKKNRYKRTKYIMVDNGSKDGSADYIEKEFPYVKVIRSDKNLFFPRGNNLAIEKTNSEFMMLINNDIIVSPDTVEKMVDRIKSDSGIAAVAGKMLLMKNKRVIDSIGTVMLPDGSPFNRGIGQIDIGQYDKSEQTFGACFGCVLLRRSLYENIIGPMDNDYFGYFEDVDWCFRANMLGYKIVTEPEANVYHAHSATSAKRNYDWKFFLIQRNFIWTILKNFQGKKAYRGVIRRWLALSREFLVSKSYSRKWTSLRIIIASFLGMPKFIIKRLSLQKRRIVSDAEIFRFSINEYSFFDPVKYEPIYSLDNLERMFERASSLDVRDKKIYRKIRDLNASRNVTDKKWNRGTKRLILSLQNRIGERPTQKFLDSICDQES